MALYAAGNIMCAIENFKQRGYAQLGGLIQNSRNVTNEDTLVQELADEAGVPVSARIPRSTDVQTAEEQGRTVVFALPQSPQAQVYRDLARRVLEDGTPADRHEGALHG